MNLVIKKMHTSPFNCLLQTASAKTHWPLPRPNEDGYAFSLQQFLSMNEVLATDKVRIGWLQWMRRSEAATVFKYREKREPLHMEAFTLNFN